MIDCCNKLIIAFFFGYGLVSFAMDMSTIAQSDEPEPLYCYDPYGMAPTPEFKAEWILIHMNWLEDGDRGGEQRSSWLYDAATNSVICEMWGRDPEQIEGDPDMYGLGHEYYHCARGDFHK